MNTHQKAFGSYEAAYECYSDILSGRDRDRQNPTIIYSAMIEGGPWIVVWMTK